MFGVFGEKVRRNTLVSWRKSIRCFGENLFGDFGENVFGDYGEKHVRRLWRKTCSAIVAKTRSAIIAKNVFGDFGEYVFGDNVGVLERRGRRGYGDFVLEFVME